jgi:biotin carboxyl carrier protein
VKLNITIEGKVYEVEVEVADPGMTGPSYYPPLHTRVPAAPAQAPKTSRRRSKDKDTAADENKVCRSPLAGAVSRINVRPGQTIQENDVLVVLEAMKMETVITAPFSGKVKAINAAVGDAVTQGQVLVEIE